MPINKKPIDTHRVRHLPAEGFSWIDRRFVREGFIERLPAEAILTYFFLVAVGDAKGLSFYADPTISRLLKLSAEELSQSRARLIEADLILYRYPLYQVLPLPAARRRSLPSLTRASATPRSGGDPMSIDQILTFIAKRSERATPEGS
jgi:hypothetical protein